MNPLNLNYDIKVPMLFDSLVTSVARQRFTPDYARSSNVGIVVEYLAYEFDLYQLSMRALILLGRLRYDGKQIPLMSDKAVIASDAEEIVSFSVANFERVKQAYAQKPDMGLFLRYIERRRRRDLVRSEYMKRLTGRPIGALLSFAKYYPEQERLPEINPLLNNAEAYVLLEDRHQAIIAELESNEPEALPFPQLIRPLSATETFWLRLFREEWWPYFLRSDFKNRLSVLEGRMESIPGTVRDRFRAQRRTESRRKKILAGKQNFPQKGPPSWRAEWDWSIRAKAHRSDDIATKLHSHVPGPEEVINRKDELRTAIEDAALAYRIAEKRSGNKGRLFLDALQAGGDVTAAAAAAGITRRTGHRIKHEIEKLLPRKKIPR
jgi:hypothetical protein